MVLLFVRPILAVGALLVVLAACAPVDRFAGLPSANVSADFPKLVPIDQILAEADAVPSAPGAQR